MAIELGTTYTVSAVLTMYEGWDFVPDDGPDDDGYYYGFVYGGGRCETSYFLACELA